jgi:CRISPR system Cascade subunit CasB
MATEVSAPESASLASIVSRIAGLIEHGGGILTAGDAAALRRMDPREPAAAFFKLEGAVLDTQLPNEPDARIEAETRWAAIVVGLAHLGMLHKPGIPLGRALVRAQFSELRFARLIRADTERLVDELPMMARVLAAKAVPADWTGAALLLLSLGRRDEETSRRQLARDFYSAATLADRNQLATEKP